MTSKFYAKHFIAFQKEFKFNNTGARMLDSIYHKGASPVFKVCHKLISLVYSLFQYIIGDGILLSWTGPCDLSHNIKIT